MWVGCASLTSELVPGQLAPHAHLCQLVSKQWTQSLRTQYFLQFLLNRGLTARENINLQQPWQGHVAWYYSVKKMGHGDASGQATNTHSNGLQHDVRCQVETKTTGPVVADYLLSSHTIGSAPQPPPPHPRSEASLCWECGGGV